MSTTIRPIRVTNASFIIQPLSSDLLEIRRYAICILFSGPRSFFQFIRSAVNHKTMNIFRLVAHDPNSRQILVKIYWQLSILNQSQRFLLFYCSWKALCLNFLDETDLNLGFFSTLVNTEFTHDLYMRSKAKKRREFKNFVFPLYQG